MATEETLEPIYYNSVYRHGVDEKRRVQIPAKWRPAKPEIEFTLIWWSKENAGDCLRVLPPEEMAALMRDIKAMPSNDPNKVVLKRIIGSKSIQVMVDKSGRICLPEEMARAAGIKDQAILVGLLDRFEIWSPDRYDAVKTSDDVTAPEAFRMIE